jgi:hypothetical protein
MQIAIDFDDTFTRDPEGWLEVISLLQGRGHSVVCITLRSDLGFMGQEVTKQLEHIIPIVFCHGKLKRKVALEAGYKIDVWIDDMPGLIDEPGFIIG